jgi:hypothetical protein
MLRKLRCCYLSHLERVGKTAKDCHWGLLKDPRSKRNGSEADQRWRRCPQPLCEARAHRSPGCTLPLAITEWKWEFRSQGVVHTVSAELFPRKRYHVPSFRFLFLSSFPTPSPPFPSVLPYASPSSSSGASASSEWGGTRAVVGGRSPMLLPEPAEIAPGCRSGTDNAQDPAAAEVR